MSTTTLIVPGLHGSGPGHWQDWWRKDNPDAVWVSQANYSSPQADAWLANLEAAVRANPHCRIVAHSLGTILTARLARSPVAPLVRGALLVAPADITRTSEINRRSYEFGAMPHDRLPFPTLVVASRDDIYMSLQMVRRLAQDWGARVHDLGYAGHINIASGFGRWPQAYGLAAGLGEPPVARSSIATGRHALV